MEKIYCKFCDNEVSIVASQSTSGNTAYKSAGVKNPKTFVCADCAKDETGEISHKFEQA